MSLDLRLLPEAYGSAETMSHDILSLQQDQKLFKLIMDLQNKKGKLERPFSSFSARSKDGEPCYGKTIETPYGLPIRSVTASELVGIGKAYKFSPSDYKNKGIFAMLACLQHDLKIMLYWH